MVSLGHDRMAAQMTSRQLRWPAQGLYKIKPTDICPRNGQSFMSPNPSLKSYEQLMAFRRDRMSFLEGHGSL